MMTTRKNYTKGFIARACLALQQVITQDCPSVGDPYPSGYKPSKYYGNDGKRSVLGYLLFKKYYQEKFEGHPPSNIELMFAVGESMGYALNDDDQALLCILEDCHDLGSERVHCLGGDFVEHMLTALEKYADDLPDQVKEFL